MKSLSPVLLVLCAFIPICCDRRPDGEVEPSSHGHGVRIRLATTTSTEDSGLLEVLLPPFEEMFGVKVDVVAVGSGKALKLAENGDVDAVLTHDPASEEAFIGKGFGMNRRRLMHNDFVVVGPSENPAGIAGGDEAVVAFEKIGRAGASFVSRGDDSGTHMKEKELWRLAGIEPDGGWYMEGGQGMGGTLVVADEKSGYCLVDRATFISFKRRISLSVLCQGDRALMNPYSIIAVNPARHPHAKYVEAMKLIAWVTSPEGQKIIREFKKDGEVLFHPSANVE